MRVEVDSQSRVPIYAQIERQIRSLVAAGQLRPGDQLPPIRDLAAELGVNYNTVARAYMELDRDDVVSSRRGRGTFVAGAPDAEQMVRRRAKKLRSILLSALEEARRLGYERTEIARAFRQELEDLGQTDGRGWAESGEQPIDDGQASR